MASFRMCWKVWVRHPLISFEKAWLSSLPAHDPDCRIYARYEGDDVLVITS